MSPKIPVRDTAYSEYVNSNLPLRVASGGGAYTYIELGAMVGLKPTHNFRRRVKWLAMTGHLKQTACFTPSGGLEARFTMPDIYTEEMPE